MRAEILEFLQSQNLGVFTTTQELPWSENGQALYLKNLKKVYVDQEVVETEPLFATLDALDVTSEVTSVTVYLACDAKQTPPNLDQVITVIRGARNVTVNGVNRRVVEVTTEYEDDVLVKSLEFRFTKLT